jgi:hypothetical protein
MNSNILLDDHAENSIMQTITIAVSAILIAAGLVTAPGLINNARDNNARTDLANVAYAQEVYLGEVGTYNPVITTNIPGDKSLDETPGVKYTSSGNVITTGVFCNPATGYVIKSISTSGKSFYRTSLGAETSETLSDLKVPDCLTIDDLAKIVSPNVDIADPGTDTGTNPGTDTGAGSTPSASAFFELGGKEGTYVTWVNSDSAKIVDFGKTQGQELQKLPDQEGLTNVEIMQFASSVSNAGLYVGDRKIAAIEDGSQMQFAYVGYNTGESGARMNQARFMIFGPQFYDIADIKKLTEGKVSLRVESGGQTLSFNIPRAESDEMINAVDASGYSNGDVSIKALPSTNNLFVEGYRSINLDANSFKNTPLDYYLNVVGPFGNSPLLDSEYYYSVNNDDNYVKITSGKVNIVNTKNQSPTTYKYTTDPQVYISSFDSFDPVAPGGTWKVVIHQANATYTITDIK